RRRHGPRGTPGVRPRLPADGIHRLSGSPCRGSRRGARGARGALGEADDRPDPRTVDTAGIAPCERRSNAGHRHGLLHLAPAYPQLAVSLRQSGTVGLLVKVGATGEVQAVRVTRSAGSLLDQAAVAAAYGWTYQPARQAGTPTSSWVEEIVDFKLR